MTAKTNKKPGQGVGGGRPALVPGQTRTSLVVSVTHAQRAKVDRVSDGKPSEFVRSLIDSYPEPRK